MEDEDDKSLVYKIHLCRICQIPNNLDLINTSTIVEDEETCLDLLKFIFKDVIWVEDTLLSVVCTGCLKKVTEIAEFKRLCLNTNIQREILNVNSICKIENDPFQDVEMQLLDSITIKIEPCSEDEQIKVQRSNRLRTKKSVSNSNAEDELKQVTEPKCNRCDICGKDFKFQSMLKRHILRHKGIRNFMCAMCGRKFITKTNLSEHLKSHSSEYNYACDLCPKKFKTNSNLKSHKNVVHVDPKYFKHTCTECGKKFSSIFAFKDHLNRHMQIRNFPCDICDKSFVSKSEMRKHLFTHSANRQYKCDLCPAEYKDKSCLLVHQSIQHNTRSKISDKIYDCSYCGKSIAFKHKFERHVRTHTGVQPYQCNRCATKFSCKSYVKRHYMKKHGINIDTKNNIEAEEYYTVLEVP